MIISAIIGFILGWRLTRPTHVYTPTLHNGNMRLDTWRTRNKALKQIREFCASNEDFVVSDFYIKNERING